MGASLRILFISSVQKELHEEARPSRTSCRGRHAGQKGMEITGTSWPIGISGFAMLMKHLNASQTHQTPQGGTRQKPDRSDMTGRKYYLLSIDYIEIGHKRDKVDVTSQ